MRVIKVTQLYFKIVFEGSPSYSGVSQSILAIDDIKVSQGECSGIYIYRYKYIRILLLFFV